MALLAVLRKSACSVIWIRGALEVFQMAACAGCGGQIVIVVYVAIDADTGWSRVRVG
jgi:hypothetical protein